MITEQQKQVLNGWLDGYRALIFKIVRSYAFSPMDQDDLFQEIIIQLWRSIPSFRGECAPSTWIYRISLNTSVTWLRREQKHIASKGLLEPVLQERADPIDERLQWLYQEIQKLDQIDRSIAIMLLDGFSYKDMAVVLGITESNVGVKVHRIKKQLTLRSKQMNYYGV